MNKKHPYGNQNRGHLRGHLPSITLDLESMNFASKMAIWVRMTHAKQDGFPREVGFAIRVVPPARGLDGEISGPDDQLTSNLLTMSSKLLTGLHTMSDHQEYMRERENKHRILAGLTFHTVMQWTILEAIILILIAFAQVLYLKKFFEQRRYL